MARMLNVLLHVAVLYVATQSANHTDYLIFKLYVYYLFLENALNAPTLIER